MGSVSSNNGGFYYSVNLLQVSENCFAGVDDSNGVNIEHHRKLLSL